MKLHLIARPPKVEKREEERGKPLFVAGRMHFAAHTLQAGIICLSLPGKVEYRGREEKRRKRGRENTEKKPRLPLQTAVYMQFGCLWGILLIYGENKRIFAWDGRISQ